MTALTVLVVVVASVAATAYDPDCNREADAMQGQQNSLSVYPPSIAAGETLEVDVHKVAIRQMWMSEAFQEMYINGYVDLSWKDRRLRWNHSDWKTDALNIKNFGRLWVPDLNSDKYQTSAQTVDYINYEHLKTTMTGNVTARLEYRVQARCEIDYADYPNASLNTNYAPQSLSSFCIVSRHLKRIFEIERDGNSFCTLKFSRRLDRKHCCFNLRSSLYRRYIKYFILPGKNGISSLDVALIRASWHIDNSWVRKVAADDDFKAEELEMCVTARGKSSTLSIELTIPLIISAPLVLLAPFFGTFQKQIHVKMFSILLQFLCFQFLASKTPQAGFGESVPRIYLFYAFTLCMSVVSLIITVIISAAARVVRKVPPAHRFTLLASVMNANVCCGMETKPVIDGTSSKDASSDWLQIHVALNDLSSLVIVVAYISVSISTTSTDFFILFKSIIATFKHFICYDLPRILCFCSITLIMRIMNMLEFGKLIPLKFTS
ncbi:hypothetical protein PRIPAC_96058, partial [Pristionchus pacificus]|uniref:Transmembrane ion channel n=1 Tax=Pristionchus pacificus TaxID=54126 RepID=A0A2A6D1U5_PRIPA